ncbi:MAG TPA: ABC transporter substrate-binding protein [Methanocorpusculum sp.]|nr:ABC transporter substrate-binding protein [Methanocorpusculum sp.]
MSHEAHHKKFFGGWKLTVILILLVIAAFCIIFIPFFPAVADDEEIVIGALLPLNGTLSEIGNEYKNGIDLAASELQKSGRKITVKYIDTESDVNKAIDGYFSLLKDGVQVIIGPVNTSEAEAIAPYAEMYKTPVLTFATGRNLEEYTEYVFRFVPSDIYFANTLVNYAERNEVASIAVVWKNDQYGADHAKYVLEKLEEEVPETVCYNIALTSVDAAINQIEKSRPSIIFIIPEDANQLSELCSAAYKKGVGRYSQWFSSDTGFGQELIENIDCLDLIIGISRLCTDNPGFNERYEKAYGTATNGYAAYGYDAATMLADVINSVGFNGEDIADALKSYRRIGLTGPIYFDEALDRFPLIELVYVGYKEWYGYTYTEYVALIKEYASEFTASRELNKAVKDAWHKGDMELFEKLYKFWWHDDYEGYKNYLKEITGK